MLHCPSFFFIRPERSAVHYVCSDTTKLLPWNSARLKKKRFSVWTGYFSKLSNPLHFFISPFCPQWSHFYRLSEQVLAYSKLQAARYTVINM
jgi:hypothetical protein